MAQSDPLQTAIVHRSSQDNIELRGVSNRGAPTASATAIQSGLAKANPCVRPQSSAARRSSVAKYGFFGSLAGAGAFIRSPIKLMSTSAMARIAFAPRGLRDADPDRPRAR